MQLFGWMRRNWSITSQPETPDMIAILKWTSLLIVLVLATGAGLFFYSPALLVDTIDRIASRADVEKVADGIAFDTNGNRLDIWSTAAKSETPRPVLVFFYGGGWADGDRREYSYAARPFVEAGYIVVLPDYRKVPVVRFPGFVEDSAAAVKWVQANIARYGGDASRVSVAGHSAGAYNALMLALDPQWLGDRPVTAAISLAGAADFYPFTSKRAIARPRGYPARQFRAQRRPADPADPRQRRHRRSNPQFEQPICQTNGCGRQHRIPPAARRQPQRPCAGARNAVSRALSGGGGERQVFG